MTGIDIAAIRSDLIRMIREVRDDWEYAGEVDEATGLFRDLGFESIDAVALGAALEDHLNCTLPLGEFLTRAREENWEDITVQHLLNFLVANLPAAAQAQRHGA